MEEPPIYILSVLADLEVNPFNIEILIISLLVILLLVFSAFISGAEVALFSLRPKDIEDLKKNKEGSKILLFLKQPNKILATILIANNFINVAIVVLSTYLITMIFSFTEGSNLEFVFQIIVITTCLVLFGEITPKIYANINAKKFSLLMSYPLSFIQKIFFPLIYFLITSTEIIDNWIQKKQTEVSVEEIAKALDLTEKESKEEQRILRSILEFGETDVKEIMRSRVEVVAIEEKTSFFDVLKTITNSGFSRIPVYKEQFDNILGVLYTKDLIPFLQENNTFHWIDLCRSAYFVPETKMINDLLKDFQIKKNHIAIVVDEYGGTSGIVTLEDVLEEIVGEINDEFDVEDNIYSKLDDHNYVFEGRISLIDFLKTVKGRHDCFDSIKGDADSLAGLILEIKGKIPRIGETCRVVPYTFLIESSDSRKIKRLKVSIDEKS